MARTINQIQTGLINGLKLAANSVGLTIHPEFWSKYDYKNLILNQVSTAHAVQEQIQDSAVVDIEAVADRLPPATKRYIQRMMKDVFEYNAITVPIVQLNSDQVYYYPSPNPNQRIVKYCSVNSGSKGTTIVKLAGVGPSKITGLPLSAAQTFVNIIGVPGISYIVVSDESDKLFIDADIYFNGLYSARIQADVITAITSYLSSIDFDGKISMIGLYIAIKGVQGVNDVVFNKVQARNDAAAIDTGENLVLSNTELSRNFQTIAGYIVPENTAGYTFTDDRSYSVGTKNLNFIAE